MSNKTYNVLVVCTGNSSRSIMAEAILNREGAGRIRAFSAGSRPKDAPNPIAIALLKDLGYDTASLRSKSWEEFTAPATPKMDFILTVCEPQPENLAPTGPAIHSSRIGAFLIRRRSLEQTPKSWGGLYGDLPSYRFAYYRVRQFG